IHRWYLRDLSAVARLMDGIAAGDSDPAALAPAVRGMTLAENLRLAGTVCGVQCMALTNHHQIEDSFLYPALERHGNARLNAVLARLRDEHVAIHDLIGTLADHAEKLAESMDAAQFEACATAFAALDRAVRNHFRYEEDEIGPAIGFFDVPL
ncbi:MAG TPA: hemerythrin domain-containing protein, partial [Paracoccus sp. (in: a-proteobacteria)]|nr:hemerythrin domain-containing protein [Paracoccus sp. (in: a-proteobacteria)]